MKLKPSWWVIVIVGVLFNIWLFVFISHAQDLFDRAEIEFDIDYIDIDKVEMLGGTINGQVMAVWMKSGSVLTKTLSKSNIEFSDDREFDNGEDYAFTSESVFNKRRIPIESVFNKHRIPIEELRKKPGEELVSRVGDLINGEWSGHTTYRIFDMMFALKLKDYKGVQFVQLTMDVIKANLKYYNRPQSLLAERDMLLQFAEKDEQLTKMANDFLEENGFNKEKE